ncbi:MAG: DUF2202 domain-containing protein [Actinomycetales bacterium]|nr:DUF2202 domain-containing protein [Actinomycetales bacterium]
MNATRTATRRIIGLGAALAVTVPAALAFAGSASAAVPSDTAGVLQAMAAEEKLARDVYTALGKVYDVNQFARVAVAEQQHLTAVRTVMANNGVTDPTAGDAYGYFDDAAVQKLYNDLVAQGKTSLAAAAQVGITIEKLDIADLEDALAGVNPADVTQVLTALKRGSENHLVAFTRLASGDTAMGMQNGTGAQNGYGGGRGMQGRGMGAGGQAGTQAGTGLRDGSCLQS